MKPWKEDGVRGLFWLFFICAFTLPVGHTRETTKLCADGTIVGMASPAAMTGGGDIRQTYGRGYVMTHAVYSSACCGVVKQWTLHVARWSALPRPLALLVWRPVVSTNGPDDGHPSSSSSSSSSSFSLDDVDDVVERHGQYRYKLVGKTDAYIEARRTYRRNDDSEEDDDDDDDDYYYSDDDDDDDEEDDDDNHWRSGLVTVRLSEQQRISIQPGDIIGWRSPEGDVISYTSRYYNLDNIVVNRMGEVKVGDTYQFPAPLRSHRTYGINAVLTAGSPPVITNLPADVEMRSDVKDGAFVFNVTAYDITLDDVLTFVIINEDDDDDDTDDDLPFVIDSRSGVMVVQGSLVLPSYDVRISVQDPCGLHDVGTLTVLVTASKSPPEMSLPETIRIPLKGHMVDYTHNVVIEDDDGDDVTCEISDVDPFVSFFSMKGTQLHIQTNDDDDTLESRQEMTYQVSVTCSDDESNATKTVDITLFRSDPPAFVNTSATVRVSARASRAGDIIHVVQVTSQKEPPLVFLENEPCDCPFYLSPDGSVAVTRSLMSENVTSYSMDFYVTNGVSTMGSSTLHVIITDINHPPQFVDTPHSVSVEENSDGVVLRLTVTDSDGDDVRVSLLWTPEDAAYFFWFNETDKTVAVRPYVVLDYEYMKALGMTQMRADVTASDGFKRSSVEVIVTISDVNEQPQCSQSSFYIVCDEGKKGTTASDGTFLISSCFDPESEPLRYLIKTPPTHNISFVIDTQDATLTYASTVDVKLSIPKTLTSFVVGVCDVGGLCVDVFVEAEIRNVPMKPRILNLPRRVSVSEDYGSGQVFALKVFDEDEDDADGAEDIQVFFRVLVGDPGLFEIRGSALYLKESRNFDYEIFPLHLIELAADNGHVTSEPATLTLEVMDVNEAPSFSQDYVSVVAEEGKAGAIILSNLKSMVTDQDINDTHYFSLLSHTHSFTIHPHSAIVSLATDYDVDNDVMPYDVTLTVKVTDSGQLSSTIQVFVKFLNKNENPRIVNLPREITMPEDALSGRVIYHVIAEDPDGDEVIVRMSVAEGSGRLFHFNETDGTLILKEGQRLDFEATSVYVLRFTADDGVLTSSPMTLTLLVDDVNEAPYFTSDTFYISAPEGRAGTTISTSGELVSSARDPEGDHLSFHLLPGPYASAFSVDTETAELTFASDFLLTRQTSPLIVNLTLCVTDSGGLTNTAKMVVTIYDVNMRPRLLHLPVNVTVPQTMEEGTLLYTVYAEDDDSDPLSFRLNSLNGGSRGLFHINSSSGEIRLSRRTALNATQTPFIQLQISVTDGLLSSQATILGIIVEEGLTPPDMTSEFYVINIKEDELGFFIPLPDNVFDKDVPSSHYPLTYHITGGSGQDNFQIDSTTGNLLYIGNDDMDDPYVNSTFSLDITLRSEPGVGKKWVKSLEIHIVDVNDHAPEVTSDLLTWFVSKLSKTGIVIGRIEARDLDKGENAKLTFELDVPDLPKDTFTINSRGEVMVNKTLDTVSITHTTLKVTVRDHGQPPLSTSVAVFIVFT